MKLIRTTLLVDGGRPLIFVHIFRTPLGKITNRHIPLSVFGLTFILWALGAVEGSYCTMFGTGLIVSWVYLRFYQVVPKDRRARK